MQNKEAISITIDKEKIKKLRKHCEEECKDISKVINKLVGEYIENV